MRGRSPTFAAWLTLWGELVRIRSETGADGGGIMARICFVCLQTANAACLPAVKPIGVHFVTYTIYDIRSPCCASPNKWTQRLFPSFTPLLAEVGIDIAQGEGALVVRHLYSRARQGVVQRKEGEIQQIHPRRCHQNSPFRG